MAIVRAHLAAVGCKGLMLVCTYTCRTTLNRACTQWCLKLKCWLKGEDFDWPLSIQGTVTLASDSTLNFMRRGLRSSCLGTHPNLNAIGLMAVTSHVYVWEFGLRVLWQMYTAHYGCNCMITKLPSKGESNYSLSSPKLGPDCKLVTVNWLFSFSAIPSAKGYWIFHVSKFSDQSEKYCLTTWHGTDLLCTDKTVRTSDNLIPTSLKSWPI